MILSLYKEYSLLEKRYVSGTQFNPETRQDLSLRFRLIPKFKIIKPTWKIFKSVSNTNRFILQLQIYNNMKVCIRIYRPAGNRSSLKTKTSFATK